MNGKICVALIFLSVVPLCHSLQSSDDELFTEVKKRLNPEIDFDLMLQKYNLTSFRTLLINAKLFDRLNVTNTSYTVFAPTNKAILGAASLLSNATRLPEILLYHVHLGAFPTNKIQQNMKLKTLLGGQKKIRFERYKGAYYGSCKQFNSVVDETYDNGILDIMNGVMVPPEGNIYDILSVTSTFSSFFKYANTAGIQELLQNPTPETLLVPNDDAFAKLPQDVKDKMKDDHRFLVQVLQYHLLEGIICSVGFETGSVPTYEGEDISVTVSGTKVVFNKNTTLIQADIIAYNGVMHVIDTVLVPQ